MQSASAIRSTLLFIESIVPAHWEKKVILYVDNSAFVREGVFLSSVPHHYSLIRYTMSDREFSANDDLSLPKATVQKIITEILPPSSGQTFSKDARDLLMECCVEFITLISSEANDISEKEAKKTIACEHVERALRDLGFGDYVPEVLAVAEEHKEQLKSREKKQSKMEQSGLSEEELLRQQQELFRSATEKYHAAPE
ncbi:negative cofactor 2 transcription regulator complex subunit NCB2 [Aspergillus alliaceus]|uniref:negative cofactor 2 transcription regulator complex subunit NCB2 n=1 Tax=Petromyces alliaceus TaxID=209559 RepID=UPI0012A68940|nr:histone-fold-containing protein [Aspergillus alliaceus]KAB8228930.1 histone-fold-containing protein [Aspergillus alliaceus]